MQPERFNANEYMSSMNRNVFACKTEDDILRSLMDRIHVNKSQGFFAEHGVHFVATDAFLFCLKCRNHWSTATSDEAAPRAYRQ